MSNADDLKTWLKAKGGQTVLLISASDEPDFTKAFLSVRQYCKFPVNGSMWECPLRVQIPGRQKPFFPISLNGDVQVWEHGIRQMCADSDRDVATVAGNVIVFSSGDRVSLCELEFFPRQPLHT